MLDPHSRHTYLQELRPPAGYQLDFALATTYSLDLLTLLMAPLSMIFSETSVKEEAVQDPVAILEAMRRCAGRFAVFCDHGRIAVPKKDQVLYRYLEPAVIQVKAPYGGVFHPKVWVLRFTSPDKQLPFYRYLCLSRNLTFDRSWDTVLALEGEVANRQRSFSETRPLVDFLQALPALSVHQQQVAGYATRIEQVIDEVRRVKFTAPSAFYDEIRFEPTGIRSYRKVELNEPASRRLIVSPFLSDEQLRPLAESGRENVLISRRDSLDAIDPDRLRTVATRTAIYIIDEDVEQPAPALDDQPVPATSDLSGLHAKLYITEHDRKATVRTGSLNATQAAWSGRNVEFMVTLRGGYTQVGINAFLGADNQKQALRQMLIPYRIPDEACVQDAGQKHLERLLQDARSAIAGWALTAQVNHNGTGTFDLTVSADRPLQLPGTVTGVCFPISRKGHVAQPLAALHDGEPIRFAGLSLISLTGFFAFELTATHGGKHLTEAFVLNLPVTGMPEERDERLIQHLISDRGRFLRYLLFLLAEGDQTANVQQLTALVGEGSIGEGTDGGPELPLLEEMVRAYSRYPEKIDRIASLVRDLRSTPAGQSVLPDGFDALWTAFESARKEDRPA